MPEKQGLGGNGLEKYDPETGRYISQDETAGSDDLDDLDFELDDITDESYMDLEVDEEEPVEEPKSGLDAIFNKKEKETTFEEDCAGANPAYKYESSSNGPYHINCQRCIAAYDLRRRGYDVEALPRIEKWDEFAKNNGWVKLWKGGSLDDLIPTGAKNWVNMANKTKKAIIEMGDGARCVIKVSWSKYSGHVLIAENQGGKIQFLDPQDGTIYKDDSWCFGTQCTKTKIFRIDNKEIDESKIQKACKNVKGEKKNG